MYIISSNRLDVCVSFNDVTQALRFKHVLRRWYRLKFGFGCDVTFQVEER